MSHLLVIVQIIYQLNIRAREAKNHPPIAAYRNRPETCPLALQRTQSPTWQVYRLGVFGTIKQRKNSPQPLGMVSANSLGGVGLEKGPQAFMSKADNHSLSVTYHITFGKTLFQYFPFCE